MTETAHTPTPWAYMVIENKYHEDNKTIVTVATVYKDRQAIARCHSVEDAAFIVKACNAHDELVEVLKSYRDEVLDGVCGQASHDRVMQINETIRAILAKVQP